MFNRKNSKCLVIIFFILSSINLSFCQNYYQRLYGDECYDAGYSIYLDNDSSLIMTGYTCSYYNGTDDVYLIHTALNGSLIWSQSIDILGDERGYSVIENFDAGGNPIYIVTGDTRGFHLPSYSDAFLMQTDQNGVPAWVQTFSRDKRNERGRCVILTRDQSYLVAGFSATCDSISQDTCFNCNDVFLFKTDLNGTLLWAKYIDIAGGDDQAFKVIEVNKKYYVTGSTRLQDCKNTDIFLMQVDPNGTVDWVKTYGDSLGDFSYSIKATADSGLIMVGHTFNYSPTTAPNVHVIKTNYNGIPQWKTTYNSLPNNQQNFGRDIAITPSGYFITGYSDVKAATSFDLQLIKININGTMAWQRVYGGLADDRGYSLVSLNNGVAMLGYTYSYGMGLDDVYLVRTTMTGRGCEEPVDTNYKYIDTLYHVPTFHVDTEYIQQEVNFSYVSPKNVDSLCYDTSHASPRFGKLSEDILSVYPNPVRDASALQIQLLTQQKQNCIAELFDQLGRRAYFKEDNSFESIHKVSLDIHGLEKGVYILKVNGYLVRQIIISDN